MYTNHLVSPYLEQAELYLSEKRVLEIFFSQSTYQVHLDDKNSSDPAWVFLQLADNKNVKDFFCSCQNESGSSCEHTAAALLAIFRGHESPLHKRFEGSFWHQITQIYAQKWGYDTDILSKSESQYTLVNEGKTLFSIQTDDRLTQKFLQETLIHRKQETEETSLKFSNLPKKEWNLWREGRPSRFLRYELSFWSDLAKFLMLAQENETDYQVKFDYIHQLPSQVSIQFPFLKVSFLLDAPILEKIIPYLSTIQSPLEVHHTPSLTVDKIVYCPKEKTFHIHPEKKSVNQKKNLEGKSLGNWIYLPKKGFYPKSVSQVGEMRSILSHQIDRELEKNASFFHKYLDKTAVNLKPIKPKYSIEFDKNWNLEIHLFLFDITDFQLEHSSFFGKWVYIDQKGFFRLQENVFHQPSLFIPRDKVTEFIRQYRYWLNSQKHFEVHLAPLETQISYQLNTHNQLIFSSKIVYESDQHYDFGEWIYIKGQGFYSKPRHSSPIQGGLTIQKNEIPKFIHLNTDDLESIPHFFASKCPLKEVSLALYADLESQSILIEPTFTFHPEYENKKVLFFESFSYVPSEGFYKLPKELLLPKGFRKKVRISPADQTSFLAFQFQSLKPFISHVDPRLSFPKDLELKLTKVDENTYQLVYQNSQGQAQAVDMHAAYQQQNPYLICDAGLIQLDHNRFSWIRELQANQIKPNGIQFTPLDLIRIEATDSLYSPDQKTADLLDQASGGQGASQKPILSGFKTHLRPYQDTGLKWLWKLYQYHLSAILCDDMGLGKTLQAMALMAAIKNEKIQRPYPGYKAPKKKFLIVCPTSVIYHWQDKLQQFYPKLKVLTFYGLNRSLKRFQQKFDVLLTSYGIIRIDQKLLNTYSFDLAIYDEVQTAKNHRSLTYAALQKFQARMKLGLTGTPIENSLRELKALFDLIIPGYLPSSEQFKALFINPIERDRDPNQAKLLKKLITPFTLRRKKEDVVKDLPDKTEELARCELTDDQARLYQQTLDASKQTLIEDLKDKSKTIPYVHIFALLNKLKQICNHPKSIDPKQYAESQSGKWDLFLQLLEEARESKQKVVVFSQYLGMLDLIEEYCKTHSIGYATIRGSTRDRRTPLNQFKSDPDCEIFIGSLKAVGLGIDLTAASVVIHYDRWWNAAREQQATDRVHRIGQTKGVMVFKLMTLNTLEEKIDRIIYKKEQLMEEVVGISDEEQVKGFSREDLIDLLQFAHQDVYTSS